MSNISVTLNAGAETSAARIDRSDTTDLGGAAMRVVVKRGMDKLQVADLLDRAKQRLLQD